MIVLYGLALAVTLVVGAIIGMFIALIPPNDGRPTR